MEFSLTFVVLLCAFAMALPTLYSCFENQIERALQNDMLTSMRRRVHDIFQYIIWRIVFIVATLCMTTVLLLFFDVKEFEEYYTSHFMACSGFCKFLHVVFIFSILCVLDATHRGGKFIVQQFPIFWVLLLFYFACMSAVHFAAISWLYTAPVQVKRVLRQWKKIPIIHVVVTFFLAGLVFSSITKVATHTFSEFEKSMVFVFNVVFGVASFVIEKTAYGMIARHNENPTDQTTGFSQLYHDFVRGMYMGEVPIPEIVELLLVYLKSFVMYRRKCTRKDRVRNVAAVQEGIQRIETNPFDPQTIVQHASIFDACEIVYSRRPMTRSYVREISRRQQTHDGTNIKQEENPWDEVLYDDCAPCHDDFYCGSSQFDARRIWTYILASMRDKMTEEDFEYYMDRVKLFQNKQLVRKNVK